jgi:DNA-binding NtrC family response regulator
LPQRREPGASFSGNRGARASADDYCSVRIVHWFETMRCTRRARIMLVSASADTRDMLSAVVSGDRYLVRTAADFGQALAELRSAQTDALVVECHAEQSETMALTRRAFEIEPSLPLVTICTASERDGNACACCARTPTDADELRAALERARRKPGASPHRVCSTECLVAAAPSSMQLIHMALRTAACRNALIITGESGTGKALLARVIHRRSPRYDGPFVEMDCRALRDAFDIEPTAAWARLEQLVASASTGTLLARHVDTLNLALQVELLGVVQHRRLEHGSARAATYDVRVIGTSEADLDAAVARGEFRSDLMYRLGVLRLHAAPLRERVEDVRAIARVVLSRFGKSAHPEAMEVLCQQRWLGNVPQLLDTLMRSALATSGELMRPADLRFEPPPI